MQMSSWLNLNKIHLSVNKRQINSFFTLYWWYLYGMDQIWKTAVRFYEWTESKSYLYKVWLQIDCKKIAFLDTLVYIDQQNKLQTTLFRKSSDSQNFLNAKSEHPYSLKKSIPYSQALQIWQICSTFQEYHSHSRKLIEQFVNKGYKKDVVTQQIQKVDQLDRKQLLHQQKRHDKQCIPLSVTYSRSLPNLKDIITKHWHILQANQSCKETFSTLPIIAFRKGTSLKQIIGTNTIHNNEKT